MFFPVFEAMLLADCRPRASSNSNKLPMGWSFVFGNFVRRRKLLQLLLQCFNAMLQADHILLLAKNLRVERSDRVVLQCRQGFELIDAILDIGKSSRFAGDG